MLTANKLIKEFSSRQLTLALAESVTCGLAAHTLASVKGTGEVLTCSIVAYNSGMKTKWLKVPEKLINRYSAESSQVTKSMVMGLKQFRSAEV